MKLRVYLDTNIVLDLLGRRAPYYDAIAKIASLAEVKQVELIISPLSLATTYYVLAKYHSKNIVLKRLHRFCSLCTIADMNTLVVMQAFESGFKDFEDALQYRAAVGSKTDVILTRNKKDFKAAKHPLMTADEFIKSRFGK